jgi:hemerythrin
MALFEWNNLYGVNVRQIDQQHRRLVDMVNDLDDSIRTGNDDAVLKETLKKLLDYTAYHFVYEEKLLKQHDYSDLARHREEHNTLLWRVLDLRARYEAGEGVKASEVLDFLTQWLKNHILNSDKKYEAFLNFKGVR